MKTQNNKNKLELRKSAIIELQNNELINIHGGSVVAWVKQKIQDMVDDTLSTINE